MDEKYNNKDAGVSQAMGIVNLPIEPQQIADKF
jgi:hypothetical protein